MSQPLVTVLCLSMNHEPYVRQGFTSLVNQTYRNIEILYLDNNSRDRSFAIADEIFSGSGLRYKGFESKENRGISQNLNYLMQYAKGEYITLLSADDWWELDNVQEKIALFVRNPENGLVYGNGYRYNELDKTKWIFYEKEQLTGDIFRELLKGNFIAGTSVVLSAAAIKEVGFFDDKSAIEDWELWLRIAQKFPVGYAHKPTIFYRVTGHSLSSNINFMNKGFDYIFNKYADYPEIRIAKRNIKMGQAYQLASTKPGFASLMYILKNYQWNLKYTKHVVRCLLGMAGWKDKKHLKKQS